LLRAVFAELLCAVASAGSRPLSLVRRIVDDWASDDHLIPLPCTVAAIRARLRRSTGTIATAADGAR